MPNGYFATLLPFRNAKRLQKLFHFRWRFLCLALPLLPQMDVLRWRIFSRMMEAVITSFSWTWNCFNFNKLSANYFLQSAPNKSLVNWMTLRWSSVPQEQLERVRGPSTLTVVFWTFVSGLTGFQDTTHALLCTSPKVLAIILVVHTTNKWKSLILIIGTHVLGVLYPMR